jgi:hypothetical protein
MRTEDVGIGNGLMVGIREYYNEPLVYMKVGSGSVY